MCVVKIRLDWNSELLQMGLIGTEFKQIISCVN